MPLTTYVPGEVLTASSLNANLSFAASSPAGGLTFLSSTTFTTATNVSLPANTFSATFANYKIILTLTAVSADAGFTMRLRAAGSDNTNATYDGGFVGITAGNTASSEGFDIETSFLLGESDGGALNDEYSLTLDILSPQLTAKTRINGFYNFANQVANARVFRAGNGIFTATTSFDSLTFISSVASSISGTVRAYGYANS